MNLTFLYVILQGCVCVCVCVCVFKKSAIKASSSLTWGFPGDPVAKNRLPMQEKWVPSLMGEDHEYWGAANP